MNKNMVKKGAGKTLKMVQAVTGMVVLLLILILVNACGSSVQASQTPLTPDPTGLPDNATQCDPDNPDAPQTYTCFGLNNYVMTLTGLPLGVAPYLLPITPEEESQLRDQAKDGIECVVFIAGNLAFYNQEQALVTAFTDPVTLVIQYSDAEEQFRAIYNKNDESAVLSESLLESKFDNKLVECATKLKDSGVDTIDIVPIYLYTPLTDGYSNVHIWKPFQNFNNDALSLTMTIQFKYWGDQQVGGGTRP